MALAPCTPNPHVSISSIGLGEMGLQGWSEGCNSSAVRTGCENWGWWNLHSAPSGLPVHIHDYICTMAFSQPICKRIWATVEFLEIKLLVFLELLLASQITHLIDSVCHQERRFGVIGTGCWGCAAAFWDGGWGWAAEADRGRQCVKFLLGFLSVYVEKALQNT